MSDCTSVCRCLSVGMHVRAYLSVVKDVNTNFYVDIRVQICIYVPI